MADTENIDIVELGYSHAAPLASAQSSHQTPAAGARAPDLAANDPDDSRPAPGLDQVSLTLRRGERIALVGPSGSGKSTLMRVLAGLYETPHGRFDVDGITRLGLRDLGGVATLVTQEADVFEAWADLARHYRLDPGATAISGYSMGGGGTFKLAQRWPDLFARGDAVVHVLHRRQQRQPVHQLALHGQGFLQQVLCVESQRALHRLRVRRAGAAGAGLAGFAGLGVLVALGALVALVALVAFGALGASAGVARAVGLAGAAFAGAACIIRRTSRSSSAMRRCAASISVRVAGADCASRTRRPQFAKCFRLHRTRPRAPLAVLPY